MAGKPKLLGVVGVLLLLNLISINVFYGSEARPSLSNLKLAAEDSLRETKGPMEGLALGMMKHSGPSQGGGGHRSKKLGRILIKTDSGPSPGQGHGYPGGSGF